MRQVLGFACMGLLAHRAGPQTRVGCLILRSIA
jgi:hypothetical protein